MFDHFLIIAANNIVKQVMEAVKEYRCIFDKSEEDFCDQNKAIIPGQK